MTLGTKGKRGPRRGKTFRPPTDIAWLPDGTFFISDGYGGTRVAKFDKDGKFLMDWGSPPKDPANPGPNEFNTVHSIQISNDRRLFVVDRGHRRIQVFDENGKFLDMWKTGVRSSPYAHLISTDQYLWIADGGTNRIVKYDLDGHYLYGWGGPGGQAGQFNGPHSITTDQEGNLYLAEVFNGRVQKVPPENGRRSGKTGRPGTSISVRASRSLHVDMARERPPAGRFAPRLSPFVRGTLQTRTPCERVLVSPLRRGTAVERSDRQGVAHKPC
jgi:DNA-binding beta-propeller fold protein YncE